MLMSSQIENPFLNNISKTHHIDRSSEKPIEINQLNVAKYFKNVYIIVKKNNTPIPAVLYDYYIPQTVFDEVKNNLLIHKTSVKILKNNKHYDNIIMMTKEQLQPYNIFNYELENKNIVLPIFNIAYLNLLKYLEQYDSTNTLETIYKTVTLNTYFQVPEFNVGSNNFLCEIISSLDETKYWTHNYNCLLNITDKFTKRQFSFHSARITDKNIAKVVEKLFNTEMTKKKQNENYLKEQEIKKEEYVDAASVLEKNGFSFYKISNNSQYTKQDINSLFDMLNNKQRFLLFSNLMVSKKYCHLVVNNQYILKLMKNELSKFAPLFRYLLGYAWLRLYTEECIKKTFINTNDEFIFDINTASELPVFPFNHNYPKENPYMSILVKDNELDPRNNICGVPFYEGSTSFNGTGICNLDEFKLRFNIFCTSNPNNNIVEGFDFEKYKVGITGSIITACLQRNHPLMSVFTNTDTLTEKFNNYFNEYYANSDVDVMFIAKDHNTFIDNVKAFYENVTSNLCRINTYAKPEHVKLSLHKLVYLFVSEDFINKNINLDSKIKNKITYVSEHIEDENIKELFKPYYLKMIKKKMTELTKDLSADEIIKLKQKYPDIFNVDNIAFRVYINKSNEKIENTLFTKFTKDIDLEFTYKYSISSPYLNHNLELFPVKYDDFFSVVSTFHLPCVRGYYNGSNVYMTPSCISAHLTFMNLDYKYIVGTKDPFSIINKNRMRGFGTWLNSTEKQHFMTYSSSIPFWKQLYSVSKKSSKSVLSKNILGPINMNSKLYHPRLYNTDNYDDCMYVELTNRYDDTKLPVPLYENDDNKRMHILKGFFPGCINITEVNYNKLATIDKNGCVNPVKKWIINSTWEIYESEYCEKEEHKTSDNKPSIFSKLK